MSLKLSVVVNFYNMRREAPRTLLTLSAAYQRDVSALDYEVIVIDNGSTEPLDAEFVNTFGSNFHYYFLERSSKSPAGALNFGVTKAKGKFVSCIVDGARMVSPGILHYSLRAGLAFNNPFVGALAWHLGTDVQNNSMLDGYDATEEDLLLESINWREEGYKLFQVSVLAQSSSIGFLGGLPDECSYFMMPKADYYEIGGFDEKFQSPGGGLLNHDFLKRVVEFQKFDPVLLLGEGTFHQFHGGVATNVPLPVHPWEKFCHEYHQIRGKSYEKFRQPLVHYFGNMPSYAISHLNKLEITLSHSGNFI